VNIDMTDEENLLSTIGRGLGIVALHSATWGAEVSADGKTVWFEPARELRQDGDLTGDVFDLSEVVEVRVRMAREPDQRIAVRLLGMPVQVFAHFRNRYAELRRELRLLALAHDSDYPVAKELAELTLQVEQERMQAIGVTDLERAIAGGLDRADLDYLVPASAPASMCRLLELLERADVFCREQRLLALAATPQQLALQRWYLNEFSRQAAGDPPVPWPGGYQIEEAST
jgi:hypothetical protein